MAGERKKMAEPKWMAEAKKEFGTKEAAGAANNPRVVKFWEDAKLAFIKDDSTPWCAGFVNAMLERAGIRGTRKANARSFSTWGIAQAQPSYGSIVVLSRPPVAWQGHVGFVVSHDATTVTVLGGNQGDRVSHARFPKSRVVSYRWPMPAAGKPQEFPPPLPFSKSDAKDSRSEA